MTAIIETERLILRPLVLSDAETAFHGWTGDPEVARYVSWLPHHSIEDTIEWLREIEWKPVENDGIATNDNYIWGFVLKDSGELFGSGGLIWEESRQLFQVGYNIKKARWGKGYTTEAMKAVLRFAASNLGMRRISGGHAKENTASARVIEKLGFIYDRDDLTPHVDGVRFFDSREYLLDLVQIKPAARDELYEIAAFLHDTWRAEYRSIVSDDFLDSMTIEARFGRLQELFDEGSKDFFTMRCCGELIGAAAYGTSATGGYPDDGEITAIYLRHDFIGKGYGHDLMVKIEEALAAAGYSHFVLDVLSANARAIEFYKKHDYKNVDEQSVTLGNREYPLTIFRK
jgi:ribosomal-protein-alanine N-acetyltransferase